ncbi:MAG: tRNA pseudouridine(55) synthase TruB [Bacteroidales bacterium]|nr:tRNA pseudouridine(55) synthase TruB [Bacteroidales bacterium]
MNIDLKQGGYFLVDKPYTWTSFQVVKKLKTALIKLTGEKKFKIGHAGTLDPLATGLLVICLGSWTKRIEEFQQLDKVYTGSFHLGATTKSFDMEHEEDAWYPTEHITDGLINTVAQSFIGNQEQVPPVYSALKVGGKRLFSYARQQQEVEVKTKNVCIYDFVIEKIKMPEVYFRIKCSKGTYIRSIARDFGQRLNSGAYLSSLRRESIGQYNVESAKTPDQWQQEIINGL